MAFLTQRANCETAGRTGAAEDWVERIRLDRATCPTRARPENRRHIDVVYPQGSVILRSLVIVLRAGARKPTSSDESAQWKFVRKSLTHRGILPLSV